MAENVEDDEYATTFLTTRQVATLLHVKERKIYDLAASGEIPATRAGGKWLFHRGALFRWLETQGNTGSFAQTSPPNVVLGSHDPLLEWAIRQSECGLATYLDGSMDGLLRLAAGEGIAAGVHIPDSLDDPGTGNWNLIASRKILENEPVVLIEWAWRARGLILPEGNPLKIGTIADLRGKRIAPRQEGAGSQLSLERELAYAEISQDEFTTLAPMRSETDAALAVADGRADACFGLQCIADRHRLDFIPVLRERFDLLIIRRDWFEKPLQTLLAFCKTNEFLEMAAALKGYDVSGLGAVRANGR